MSLVSYDVSDSEDESKPVKNGECLITQKVTAQKKDDSKKVRITIPPIVNDKEEPTRSFKLGEEPKGLFSVLPAPTNTKIQFMPNSLKRKLPVVDNNIKLSNVKKNASEVVNKLANERHVSKSEDMEPPSLKHRQKHQITYLAYQAKLNEQELQNQWALNKMTRKQTQEKYGF